jgi:hypothetical protein
VRYEKYSLDRSARLALNYLTSMVDEREDWLPYWLVNVNTFPAWAKHCRVDDAELVASWYSAIVAVRRILDTDEGHEVEEGFKRHLFKHWGDDGLRYHAPYPWTHTIHHSFHEDSYILAGLNTAIEEGEATARDLAHRMVRGLRAVVIHRRLRTFWNGDFPIAEPVYEFPNDVLLQKGGFDLGCVTGRGEPAIRNGIMLHAVVRHYQLTGDEVSLDLATGLANHLIGLSRSFNYRGEFFGHVHSTVWIAAGLVLLGRLTGTERYVEFGRSVYEYARSLSSSFGWVPEYAQWHPMSEEHCETCCIKDMIECGLELVDAGCEEPWDLVNRFVRNQLDEQQLEDGSFVPVDASRTSDEPGITWRDLDTRVVGGWSGGAEPNSISLARFRSIAGCCVGTAPQALAMVWRRIVEEREGVVTVNLPIERDAAAASVAIGYPNEGSLTVRAKKAGEYRLRVLPFMGRHPSLQVNGGDRPLVWRGQCLKVDGVRAGDTILLSHPIRERTECETVMGVEFEVAWKGCDVVGLTPGGAPLKLYQRVEGASKEVPLPSSNTATMGLAPTEQKR